MFILRFVRHDRYQKQTFGTEFFAETKEGDVEEKSDDEIPETSSYTTEAAFFFKQVYERKIQINVGVHDDGREPEIHWLECKEAWSMLYVMNEAGDTIERIVAPDPEGWKSPDG